MPTSSLTVISGCPYTHVISGWRYCLPSRFVSGSVGFEFSSPSAEALKKAKTFQIVPTFELNQHPWKSAQIERLNGGIWIFHPEDSLEGVGLFPNEKTARENIPNLRVKDHHIGIVELDQTFKEFLRPFWDSIGAMIEAFWATVESIDERNREKFNRSIDLLRELQTAHRLIALCRLRQSHPYKFQG